MTKEEKIREMLTIIIIILSLPVFSHFLGWWGLIPIGIALAVVYIWMAFKRINL